MTFYIISFFYNIIFITRIVLIGKMEKDTKIKYLDESGLVLLIRKIKEEILQLNNAIASNWNKHIEEMNNNFQILDEQVKKLQSQLKDITFEEEEASESE